jgi:hypothetical protein
MTKLFPALAALTILGACAAAGEGGGSTTPPTPPVTPVDPAAPQVMGDLQAAEYDATAQTLRVQIPFAGPDQLQAFVRAAEGVLGYDRFDQQADVLFPAYAAYARQSTDGSVTGVVVADGGQFARFLGGTAVTQANYTPDTGLARYQGSYVGLLNIGPAAGGAPDGSGEATPGQSTTVTGHALLNADFNTLKVVGRINDRVADFDGIGVPLPELILIMSDLNATGGFSGSVEQRNADTGTTSGIGSYAGTLGGQQAAAIAGMIAIDNFLDDVENEFEYGIFVLDRCQPSVSCLVVTNP